MFLKAFKNRLPKQTNLRMFASLDIAGEPTYPKMVSASLPGPITKAKTAELGETTCNLAANIGFMVDIQKSKGNYICDADGNTFLDMFMNISSTAMGHNHPSVLEAARSDEMVSLIANRTAQGMHPISQTKQLLDDAFMSVAPAGMTRVGPAMCGSCSVEAAFKHACIAYAQRKRGSMSAAPSQEELASCLKNQAPGSPDYAILSFKSAFHGRMFGCLSTTRSKAIHKLDMPSFDWPAVDPPRYKFPLADNEEYNRSQDDESLRSVAEIIDGVFQEKGQEVVAVVIEPILAEGGDIQISGYFANEIRKLTKEKGIYFIVDEVQSGVVTTGTYWAHEQWGLESPPDFMTFAKKMQACGFYHSEDTKMETPMRHFNTWMGDAPRVFLAANQNKMIERDNLLENAQKMGTILQNGLAAAAAAHPRFVQNVRGLGTFLAFDSATPADRDLLVRSLRANGIHQGGCGDAGVRLRPSLYFTEKHADVYFEIFNKTLQQIDN